MASSQAASPPPTTTIRFPLKNGPSQVAQYDTPLPANCASPGTPRCLWEAPVASITAGAAQVPWSVSMTKRVPSLRTPVTEALTSSAPNFTACCSIFCDRS